MSDNKPVIEYLKDVLLLFVKAKYPAYPKGAKGSDQDDFYEKKYEVTALVPKDQYRKFAKKYFKVKAVENAGAIKNQLTPEMIEKQYKINIDETLKRHGLEDKYAFKDEDGEVFYRRIQITQHAMGATKKGKDGSIIAFGDPRPPFKVVGVKGPKVLPSCVFTNVTIKGEKIERYAPFEGIQGLAPVRSLDKNGLEVNNEVMIGNGSLGNIALKFRKGKVGTPEEYHVFEPTIVQVTQLIPYVAQYQDGAEGLEDYGEDEVESDDGSEGLEDYGDEGDSAPSATKTTTASSGDEDDDDSWQEG